MGSFDTVAFFLRPKRGTPTQKTMKSDKKEKSSPAPISTSNAAPKPHRTAKDVKRDNVRSDIGLDEPKILGR
jgi:hypothetical protein